MPKKITLKTVKKMNELWDKYTDIGYSDDLKEERNKAYNEYLEYKKENYDLCTEVADDAVLELVKDKSDIHLPSVEKISRIALNLIGNTDLHQVTLNGLKKLTDEQVEALSGLCGKSRGWRNRHFCFESLETLPSSFYTTFGNSNFKIGGDLKLNGIKELSEGEQKALAKFKFASIELNSLKNISPIGFKQYKGILSFGTLTEISPELAEGMKSWKMGGLKLKNLKKISLEFATAIAEKTDYVYLSVGHDGYEAFDRYGNPSENTQPYGPELSLDSMAELMKGKYYRITFNGITDLTPEIAAVINKNPTMIDLQQLITANIHPDAFKALSAKFEGKYCHSMYCKDVTIERLTGEVRKSLSV